MTTIQHRYGTVDTVRRYKTDPNNHPKEAIFT